MKPLLAVTMGDPAGIGPEIVVKAAASWHNANMVVWGSPNVLQSAIERFAPELNLKVLTDLNELKSFSFSDGNELVCFAPESAFYTSLKMDDFCLGEVSEPAGHAAYECVVSATQAVIDGFADAIVTAPINKASINLYGIKNFCGHTELIAGMCDTENFSMQQSAENLRVAFVTVHIPLSKVAESITKEKIIATTNLIFDGIIQEGIGNPRIAIAAINPHAGENGYMGHEDIEITEPAIEALLAQGMNVEGPFPPDTLFIPDVREKFDGIVAMYHDQGHIPFKMLAFDKGVNSTLGLPIIRTSVDHGTAFNLAWLGKADIGSLVAALNLAAVKAKRS